MTQEEFLVKFISDESFRAEFKKDPKGVMTEAGLNVPDGVDIEVLEATRSKHYIVLPPLREGELSDEDLQNAQGGTDFIGQQQPGYTLMTHLPYC